MNDEQVILDEFEDEKKVLSAKEQRDLDVADVRSLLNRPEFVRFLIRLLDRSSVHATSFRANNDITNFNEGKRAFVLEEIVYYLEEADPYKLGELFFNLKRDVK